MNFINTIRRSFLILLLLVLIQPFSAYAGLGARPAYLFVNLEKHNPSGTFTVTNVGNKSQTFRANAVHFAITEKGAVEPVKPDGYSLAKWIKFNPKEFTLTPHSSREIRYSIIRRHKLKPREYWGAIEFMPLKGQKYTGKTDASGHKMSFQVLTALLIPIFGQTTGITYSGSVSDITAKDIKQKTGYTALVVNKGSGVLRLQGNLEILDKKTGANISTAKVGIFNVLPEQKRRIKIFGSDKLAKGLYTAIIRLKQSGPKKLILSYQQEIKLQ